MSNLPRLRSATTRGGELSLFRVENLMDIIDVAPYAKLGSDIIIFDQDVLLQRYEYLFEHPCRLEAVTAMFCIKGVMRVKINLKEYEISEGMLLVNLPQNIIQVESSEGFQARGIIISTPYMKSINVEPRTLMPLFKHFQRHSISRPSMRETLQLYKYAELLGDTITAEETPYKSDIVRGLISATSYKIGDIVESSNCEIDEGDVSDRRAIVYEQFMMLLSEYHCSERNVGFYAEKLMLSSKYFSKVIQQFSGKSAATWIDDYVILEAKSLLKYSGMTIQQVSQHLNFPTQSFFGKYFKHQTGMTPGEYRKRG